MSRTYLRAAHVLLLLSALILVAACDDQADENDQVHAAFSNQMNTKQQREITPGPAASPPRLDGTATAPPREYRYATAEPIMAVFNEAAFTTAYTLAFTGPFPEGAIIRWSGPNCGTVSGNRQIIAQGDRVDQARGQTTFTWVHPHPPCGNATNHSDVTVVATMEEGSGRPGGTPLVTTVCTYPGSASGTGPACQLKR